MTDKQIIIDDVDVSGCINRNDFKLASYDCYLNGGCQCKDNPNCYYKQLKRKEQECEELKSENERLQKEREKAKNYNLEYGQLLIKATNKNNKLKQTLTEIKEIAENGKRFAERYMITGEQRANVLTYANAILQKISEVIDDKSS